MEANSRAIVSAQAGPHADLETLVRRHAQHPFRKPYAPYNEAAFAAAIAAWRAGGALPLILDTGCGVGWSTLRLAEQFPDHFVFGIDQSLDRLNRGKPLPLPGNALFVRADLVDFWRLLADAEIHPARQYLLYPNPWPKIGHLARRWHGHAVFPTIVKLGGVIECRTNWQIYAEEMALALSLLSGQAVQAQPYSPEEEPMTPFERKYLASGHGLWRVILDGAEKCA